MMIWDAVYAALNSTIGGTLESLDVMMTRLAGEIKTDISNFKSAFNSNHAGYKALIEEYEEPGIYRILVPYGATAVKVTANGGGGHTISGSSSVSPVYGGNGASVTNKQYSLGSVTNFILTVGAGGSTSNGGGEATKVGSFVTLGGGKNGSDETGTGADGTGGTGATPQDSLRYKDRGKKGDNVYAVKDGPTNGRDGFCRLEWVF